MRQVTKATGTNLSNAFFLLKHRCWLSRKRGGRYHPGMHNKLTMDGIPQLRTTMTTVTMRTAATMNHNGRSSANLPIATKSPPNV